MKVHYKPGKRYEVVKATTKNINGVRLDKQEYKFGGNGSFMLSDPGAAKEIEKEYGHREGNGDVVVSPVTIEEPGHKYTFGPSSSFAKAWDEFEKRRKDKGEWVLDENQEWTLVQRELVNNPPKRQTAANKRGGRNGKKKQKLDSERD